MLPEQMPASFQATYTPIAAAGTEAQINHLARLLATQLTAAGLGKGAAEEKQKTKQVGTMACCYCENGSASIMQRCYERHVLVLINED